MDCIQLTRDVIQWQSLESVIMYFWTAENASNFLTGKRDFKVLEKDSASREYPYVLWTNNTSKWVALLL